MVISSNPRRAYSLKISCKSLLCTNRLVIFRSSRILCFTVLHYVSMPLGLGGLHSYYNSTSAGALLIWALAARPSSRVGTPYSW
jgi:hypothetical protein